MTLRSLGFVLLSPVLLSSSLEAALYYSADFSTNPTSLAFKFNSYGSDVVFGEWVGSSAHEASLVGGTLRTFSDSFNSFRGASLLLDSSTLSGGAGTYTLSFDILAIESNHWDNVSDPLDRAAVRIWTATGYDVGNVWPNQIIVQTGLGHLEGTGSTIISEEANQYFTDPGSYTISFHYSGTGAVGFFLGAFNSGDYPQPTVIYGNVQISGMSMVPEISQSAAAGILLAAGLVSRKRHPSARPAITR